MTDESYDLIRLTGDDRIALLQGQLTQDVDRLAEARSLPAAWCSPKGRVIVTCRLLDAPDAVIMAVPAGTGAEAVRRLTLYRLRSDVIIESADDLRFRAYGGEAQAPLAELGLWPERPGATADAGGVLAVRRHGDEDYVEVFGRADAMAGLGESGRLGRTAWRRQRILAGLVDIGDYGREKYTPHMLNLDRTGAISFTKGCYTGQEVVARTEHLGKAKRRLNRYRVSGHDPAPGDTLTADGNGVGEVVEAAGSDVLAVVPLARHGETLSIGRGRAAPQPLPYSLD